MTNEELLKEYPFLSILNSIYPEYYYNFDDTLLDDMPSGWRKRFGLQMCADIKQALEKNNIIIELYKVFQVKEKFGELHWYDNLFTVLYFYDIIYIENKERGKNYGLRIL